eukprot:TRINITY_DN1231_c0_g1_i2.p1 TRINITY_DN1231_c0_g1~~TRINITY_DN1231_c0_g1_i2.p1  ORF type:complete len:732 (-),score=224.06 TRINITY_DN1231_c0_g1_i2:1885-3753(-)
MNGSEVTTTEGIGNQKNGFHPVQERIAECEGSQCGYCTPGMVMSMYSLLQNNPSPSEQEIEGNIDGNICRCTGYRPILTAMKTFACESTTQTSCKKLADVEDLCIPKFDKYNPSKFKAHKCENHQLEPMESSVDGITWASATSVQDVYRILDTHPGVSTRLVVGNTAIGIYKTDHHEFLLNIGEIPELKKASLEADHAVIGAAVSIANVINLLTSWSSSVSTETQSTFAALTKHMNKIAGHQIRNAGSILGNLMIVHAHKDFPSDMFTIMLGANATVMVGSSAGVSELTLPELAHADMKGKLVLSIKIPFSKKGQVYKSYKVMPRHTNAHAYVNAAFNFVLDESKTVVSMPTIVFGGLTGYGKRLPKLEEFLIGKKVTDPEVFREALIQLQAEAIVGHFPTGKNDYRRSLAPALFYKFMLSLQSQVPEHLKSAVDEFERPVSHGNQYYQPNKENAPIGLPVPKLEAKIQASGETLYTADEKVPKDTLYAAVFVSTVASAKISSINTEKAMKMPGVVAIYTAKDVEKSRNEIDLFPTEEVFASSEVTYTGQVIGIVVADTQRHANDASQEVKVEYSDIQDPIIELDDAIAKESFYKHPFFAHVDPIKIGDVIFNLILQLDFST